MGDQFYLYLIIFGVLLPLLVIGGIIWAIVVLVRRRKGGEEFPDPGIGTLKRVYYYGLSFVALMMAASGVIMLVDFIADSLLGPRVFSLGNTKLAWGLSLTLVGAPIWFFHWRLADRAIQQFPTETQALTRKVYLYLVLAVSAALAAYELVELLRWALGAEKFDGLHLAFPLVWGGIWAFHWRLESRAGQPVETARSVRSVYVYVTSLYSLSMLVVGIGVILWQLLREAYEVLFVTEILLSTSTNLWTDTLRTGVAVALVGGGFWWWHWHRVAREDPASVLRQVYLYLFAILGGAAAVVISLSVILFGVLQWLIGVPEAAGAAAHFRFFPGSLATVLSGVAVWGYHWAVMQRESRLATEGFVAAQRVYQYLVASLGLVTLAVGLVILFSVLVDLLVPEAGRKLAGDTGVRNVLVLALTLIVVGGPLWGFYWFGAQRQAEAGRPEERGVLSRRVFIYGVFGVAVLFSLGNLVFLLFKFLNALLEGELSVRLLQDTRVGIGMLLMAGVISAYYWLVLQEDRSLMPASEEAATAAPAVRKFIISLASEAAQPQVRQLESRLGVSIRRWQPLDSDPGVPSLSEEELSAIGERIAEAPGDRVLLTWDASGIRVVPYWEL